MRRRPPDRAVAPALALAAALALAGGPGSLGAQQFDNFDGTGDGTFDGFQLDGAQDGGLGAGTGLTLSEPGGLQPDTGGEISLNLGAAAQGVFQTFPGVTGPVTSISQPPTGQGTVVALRALDKLLGQPTDIEAAIGETLVFGRIAIRVLECRFPATDPEADAYAHLEILDLQGQTLFDGWMIASSPAINALEHPRYDVWVLGCQA